MYENEKIKTNDIIVIKSVKISPADILVQIFNDNTISIIKKKPKVTTSDNPPVLNNCVKSFAFNKYPFM